MKLQGISNQGLKRIAKKVGQAESDLYIVENTSGQYLSDTGWVSKQVADEYLRDILSILNVDEEINPENFFDNDTSDIGWGDEQGNIFARAYPAEQQLGMDDNF